MTREEFRVLVEEKGPVILDGGTGSCLRKMGMPVGVSVQSSGSMNIRKRLPVCRENMRMPDQWSSMPRPSVPTERP